MRYLFVFFTISVIFVVGGFIYIYSQIRFDAYSIIDYKPKLTTQFFDRNGKLVANLFDGEHRLYTTYEEIPPRVIEALVAIEDTSFFEHSGINIEAIFRAIIKDIKAMSLVEGASTITQQLIKNVVLTREKTVKRKLNEAVLALKIENELTKEEILQRYLTHVYLGHGYYGIKSAAMGYFNKKLNELTLKESALLVGLAKAPSSYDPTRNFDLALARSHQVLSRMRSLGWISEDEYISALNEELLVFDESLTQNRAPYVIDEAIRQLNKSIDNLKTGGYSVHLTIDLLMQQIGHEAVNKGIDGIKSRDKEADETKLNGALIAMKANSGEVLALVGGADYSKSNFNRTVQSKRQPGSSFKPFLYQSALDMGYSPYSLIPDISRVYTNSKDEDDSWKPKNYSEGFDGLVTLKDALTHSRNLATINLLSSLGLETMHKKLSDLGFKNLPHDLTIALGSFGVSLWDYAKFYSIFPNEGTMVEPILVSKIVDRYGYEKSFESKKRFFTNKEQSFLIVDILRAVVKNGTGRRARVEGLEIAGKTGTTNNNVDAWFCGFSPEVEVLLWFGNDDNTPMSRFETGGVTAAPSFAYFMSEYLKEYPQTKRTFVKPDGVKSIINDKVEMLYTPTSPLPPTSTQGTNSLEEGGMIF
ncbi:MAG: PBP1A family penicillin-binding protein [Campylobacterales bacterium]|nr:PBP1A family penicillin-binding protein [Campylobacterales bacterium]